MQSKAEPSQLTNAFNPLLVGERDDKEFVRLMLDTLDRLRILELCHEITNSRDDDDWLIDLIRDLLWQIREMLDEPEVRKDLGLPECSPSTGECGSASGRTVLDLLS